MYSAYISRLEGLRRRPAITGPVRHFPFTCDLRVWGSDGLLVCTKEMHNLNAIEFHTSHNQSVSQDASDQQSTHGQLEERKRFEFIRNQFVPTFPINKIKFDSIQIPFSLAEWLESNTRMRTTASRLTKIVGPQSQFSGCIVAHKLPQSGPHKAFACCSQVAKWLLKLSKVTPVKVAWQEAFLQQPIGIYQTDCVYQSNRIRLAKSLHCKTSRLFGRFFLKQPELNLNKKQLFFPIFGGECKSVKQLIRAPFYLSTLILLAITNQKNL